MGGWNSGTFGETSPIGKNWVNLENGLARVFVKAGRAPGKLTLKAKSGSFTAAVELELAAVKTEGGLLDSFSQGALGAGRVTSYAACPQAGRITPGDGALGAGRITYEAVRDLKGKATAAEYTVFVNGVKLDFGKHRAFKPDESTGVCAPYEPVVKAIKEAGAKFNYSYNPKTVRKPLRQFCANPGKPYYPCLTLTVGKKKIDAFAGVTVIFEDDGKEKNLTNFEMTGSRKEPLTGELAAILGYIPGVKVAIDDNSRELKITTEK